MKVLVTGSKGFIGRNLVEHLKALDHSHVTEVMEYTRETPESFLDECCRECDFVFHLAGVDRTDDPAEFTAMNVGLTTRLLDALRRGSQAPVLLASSTVAGLDHPDNPYGRSKLMAEVATIEYSLDTGASVFPYRLPGVFGKWARPNYNSVVATFCYNIARDLPITVNDPSGPLTLVYIDDVVREFIDVMFRGELRDMDDEGCYSVPVTYDTTVGAVAELLEEFKKGRTTLAVPRMNDAFIKKLYSTYLSYLPADDFSYPLDTRSDAQGRSAEIMRSVRGQWWVNVTEPGMTKGNHWHHTRTEKFIVVSGEGVIRLRLVGTDDVIEYRVSGDPIEVVDIPPGYTHHIENVGSGDLMTFMWANESFNPHEPDTYPLDV